ncbi:MAG: hypothetical protein RML72_05670 [Bacteroidia bacterium]|nr:hypothetical protein [Bacteroidia bacterium]MDW8158349.1 hypothetical protein [Bacteroidia bacterium]
MPLGIVFALGVLGCEKCKNCKVKDEDRYAINFEVAYGVLVKDTTNADPDTLPDTTWWRTPISRPVVRVDTVIKEGSQEYCGRELGFVDTAKNKKVTAISTVPYLSAISKRRDTLIRLTGTRTSLRTIDCN